MKQRRRILYTAPWYPTGTQINAPFIQKHAETDSLLNDVAVLAVVCSGSPLIPRIWIEKGEWSESFSEVIVHAPSLDLSTPKWLRPLAVIERAFAYLWGYHYINRYVWRGKRPDVCHVNVLTEAAALPWLLRKFYGIPYIITEHWSRYIRQNTFPYNKFHLSMTRHFVKDASCVCPVSRCLEKAMKRFDLTNARYELVGNVVDTDIFHYVPKEREQVYHFVHVSWLRDEAKNISGMLRAFKCLDERNRTWELNIVGDGKDRHKLEQMSVDLGIADRVHFLLTRTGKELASVLLKSDALVMFSHFEIQPVSILEALACGLPVIATSVGCIPQMLADGRGQCVSDEDEAALTEALSERMKISNDGAAALARMQYVVENHGRHVVAAEFDRIYDSVLTGTEYSSNG